MPIITFDNPIPLGTESRCEGMVIELERENEPHEIIAAIRSQLRTGLEITHCQRQMRIQKRTPGALVSYKIEIKDGFLNQKPLELFFKEKEKVIQKRNKKGRIRKIDLKKVITEVSIGDRQTLQLTMREEPGKTIRPSEVLKIIFSLGHEAIMTARILKLKTQPLPG
jgi:radical SAM-linked protein